MSLPEIPTTGFKEWSVICDALAAGRQSLILRRGGIHEGRGGFRFEHLTFSLFPSRFHRQVEGVRWDEVPAGWGGDLPAYEVGDTVRVTCFAELQAVWTLTDWEKVASLQNLHIWSEATVRERFQSTEGDGRPSPLQVALVRVYRLATPWEFPYQRSHGGCRSWLQLPAPPQRAGSPLAALDDLAAADRYEEVRRRVGSPDEPSPPAC